MAGLAGLCAVGAGSVTFAAVSRADDPGMAPDAATGRHVSMPRLAVGAANASPNELDLVALIATARRRLHCARFPADGPACVPVQRSD